jgi:hypothetical protein
MNKLKVFLVVLFLGVFSLIGAQYLMDFDYGNISSDGSGNINASTININSAFIIRTDATVPTLVQNVNNTLVTSSSLTGNDGLMQLTYTCTNVTMPAVSNYFTITLGGVATSTNPLIVIPCSNSTTNNLNLATLNATLQRLLVTASSNSFILSSGVSVPGASVTHRLAIRVFRQ